LESFGKTVESAFAGIGLAVGFEQIASQIDAVVAKGDQLNTLATRMGTSVENLSQLQFAAKATSIPFQELTGAIDVFSKNLVQASEGSGRARQAFADLGIDAGKLAKLPLAEQLDIIANKIAAMPGPTQQTAAAMRIFGAAGAEILPMLRDGAAGLQRFREESDDLGATMSGSMAEGLEKAHQAIDRASQSWEGFKTQLVADMAPAIETWEKGVLSLVNGAREITGVFASPQQEIHILVTQAIEASNALDKINNHTGFSKFLDSIGNGAALESGRLKDLTDKIAALEAIANKEPDKAHARPAPADAGPKLEDVQVRAQKSITDYMQQYYNKLNEMSETDIERTVASWDAKENAAREALAEGLITQQEFAARMEAMNAEFLTPIEVTSKIIVDNAKKQFDQMEKLGDKAAEGIQTSFAKFLGDPTEKTFKKMLLSWAQMVNQMFAETAAHGLFSQLFGGNPGDKSGSGLGDLLNKGIGALMGGSSAPGMGGGSGGGGGGGGSGGFAGEGGLVGMGANWVSGMIGGAMSSSASAALGASAAAGATSGLDAAIGDILPVFATGGTFSVGGSGSTDSQLVAFRATPGENVSVGGGAGGGTASGNTAFNHTINIDARGADADRVMTMVPPMLAQATARAKVDLLNAFRRSGIAAPLSA
jgi:hypothetical protein